MAVRSVSGYVDDAVATRLQHVARVEGRTPASLVGQALGLYVSLPEAARTSLRRIEALGTAQEQDHLRGEIVRLLLRLDMDLTERRMAEELGSKLPRVRNEEEAAEAALAWERTGGS
ncbi:hypothetical protein [Salinarimonas chemoclinalis]|uniref:hypothetical protein n=1 Tax=Salinarimonas chemoclinalis TaxID=3241599 RepID=UPI003558884B